jgi:hypothetical protein
VGSREQGDADGRVGDSRPAPVDAERPLQRAQRPLRPPPIGAADDATPSRSWIWLALGSLAVLGLGVVFALPRVVPEPGVAQRESSAEADRPAISAAAADAAAARSDAEQMLQRSLRVRARLEIANAEAWGAAELDAAAVQTSTGDRLFGARRFAEASEAYARATATLETLEASRDQRLAAALDLGARALADNDADTARVQFEIAMAIEPDHVWAARGLARARAREDVVGHMARGERAEADSELEAAREAYAAAVQLDADYEPASSGFARVTAELAERSFSEAMSRALAALQEGRLDEAAAALAEAARVHPDDTAVADARQQLASARQQAELARLRAAAAVRVAAEDWQAALTIYESALAVAPGAGFAAQGLERARGRATLHGQLDRTLADPTRLYSAEPLADAEVLLASAGQAPTREPRLAAKIEELGRHVELARSPVSVTLRSDGETEVEIYRVGRLGRFEERRLELRPGDYTAVGSRAGYRDVRHQFAVRPGPAPRALVIRCEEPI